MLGLKQEGLAMELGEDWSQRRVSLLEGKEEIEPALLGQVAKALKVTPEAIKSFNEEAAFNYINTFNDHSIGAFNNTNCNFNPLDKIVELYEQTLKEKDELIEELRRMKASK